MTTTSSTLEETIAATASPMAVARSFSGRTITAIMLGVIGFSLLALNLILIEQVVVSISFIVIGAGFVLANRLMVAPTRPSLALHAATVLTLSISLAGWCATACGSLEPYEHIGGMSTAVIGIAAHVLALFLHGLARVSANRPDLAIVVPYFRAAATSWSIFLCGVSVCYLLIMLAQGSFCASCTTSHALMFVQGVVLVLMLLREDCRPLGWLSAVPLVLVGGLSVNAVYHHRAIPERVDHAGELLSYLRTAGLAAPTPLTARPDQSVERISSVASPGAVGLTAEQDRIIAARAAMIRGRTSPQQDRASAVTPLPTAAPVTAPSVAPVAASSASAGALRSEQDAAWLGDRRAPIEMHIVIDPACRACAAEISDLSDLLPRVNEGKVAIRFHYVFKNAELGQVAATILFAAGFLGPQQLWDTTFAMLSKQTSLSTMEDYLAVVPATIDRERLISVIRERQPELARLLTDARNLQLTRGVSTTPAIWLHQRGNPEPARQFVGKTPLPQLELAISSLLSDIGIK